MLTTFHFQYIQLENYTIPTAIFNKHAHCPPSFFYLISNEINSNSDFWNLYKYTQRSFFFFKFLNFGSTLGVSYGNLNF